MRFSLSSFLLAPLVLASILSATVLPNSEFALIKRKGIAKLDAGDVITCGTGYVFASLAIGWLCTTVVLTTTEIHLLSFVNFKLIFLSRSNKYSISLNQHDCNVAFLKLGGGIAGKIQFLRVNTAVTTGVSGTCQVSLTLLFHLAK